MNYKNLCLRCFSEKPIADRPCPVCGYTNSPDPNEKCLAPGVLLKGQRYIVGAPLGVGGFGITYRCFDTKIGGICAIKEYFPSNLANRTGHARQVLVDENNLKRYNTIMDRFKSEAKLLKGLRHRNVIHIYDIFAENNTAYYVMEFCDGMDLRRYTGSFTRKVSEEEGRNLLTQVMDGLQYIHKQGVLHRDIAPDNIYCTKTGVVKILDFGAARREMDQLDKSLSVIVKAGYAPIEQYGGSEKQSAYTDIYALGATFYHVMSGKAPVESTNIAAGETLPSFSSLRPDLSGDFRYVIERAMSLRSRDRFQSIAEMKKALGEPAKPAAPVTRGGAATAERRPVTEVRTSGTPVSRQTAQQTASRRISQQPVSQQRASQQPVSRRPVSGAPPALNQRAGRGVRIGAYVLDVVIWSVVAAGLAMATGLASLYPLLWVGLFTFGDMVCELAAGATPGKGVLGLRVRNKQNMVPEAGQVILRNLVKLLGIFLLLGGNEVALDDRLTDTTVYKVR